MKKCFKCTQEKEISAFYKNKGMKDGHLNKCIPCVKAYELERRANNIDYIREYDRRRARLPHRKKLNAETTKNLRINFPLKYKAQMSVNNAVRDGRLAKSVICSTCNKPGRQIEGHHDDYNKPLEVTWLCSACHKQLHRDLRKAV
jgi:hypothetical protein